MKLNNSLHSQNPSFRLSQEYREEAKWTEDKRKKKTLWGLAFDFLNDYKQKVRA